MQPGAVRVQPGSSSYTFVTNVGPFEASDGHAYDVQWRSPTGHKVTLQKGDVLVQYRIRARADDAAVSAGPSRSG